ncbi:MULTISPECIES: arginase [Halococcus]|uniref:Arginase n=1 Tax=Halococcus salifodinae DSM 8989 TaxID=1227456 RepID=M0NDL9_9EURY|nr:MULTISPECIES: arginase [Halococcus]EMA55653.1 arginase [Halococcus salifodinae DSM 8989]
MTISTIGVPMDLGADRRGVDMGPSAIRYAGLASTLDSIGRSCVDAGDLTVPHAEERDPEARSIEANAKYLDEVESVCTRLADEVASSIDGGALPLVLGGDHSIAIGTLAGASRDAEIGAIWFDAHSDVNTPETTPSGNVHGMPLAAALGMGTFADTPWANASGLREENVVLVGLRSVDEPERERIRDSAITAYTMSDIDQRGVVDVTEEALDIATDGVDGIHVSLDLDWLDPSHAPGVGTPVRGGVTYREAHSALETLADRDEYEGILRSLEVVEANPILDSHNETAELGVELAASALGKRVL